MPRIWVTRSEPFASDSAARLCEKGYEAFAAPLLTITPRPHPPLPGDHDHLIFTSRHGVSCFAAQTSQRHWPVICVGDGTATAAQDMGFSKAQSASGRAQDVIDWVRENWSLSAHITHISGVHQRGDIIETLEHLGYKSTRQDIYYDSLAASVDPREQSSLGAEPDDYVLLYSPRGAAAFVALGLQTAQMSLISLSAAIDAGLGDIPCDRRLIAEKPTELSLFAHLPPL